ncbi:phosphatidylinositol N-acetylglucosaminyltransferase [Russula brevipes]|nr:phosphatidylinositol N-acetylglucosaminyltransferase [Russula brevipes]
MATYADGAGDRGPEWERVLWRPQPFPDNYVPPTFLAALSKNPNVLPYRYWPLVLGACTISQHLSVVFVFLAVFTRLLDHTLDPRLLVVLSSAAFVTGCIIWRSVEYFGNDTAETTPPDRRAHLVKASLLIFLALIALAPILRTLTAPTSADSISALTVALFLIHAALADYSYAASPAHFVLSINAAISAAVVLASRLQDDLAVFALMLFSVEAFALFPVFRRRIQSMSTPVQSLVTLLLGIGSLAAPFPLLCVAVLTSVTFGAPAVLIWAQQYKYEIRGPWDAATPCGFERGERG